MLDTAWFLERIAPQPSLFSDDIEQNCWRAAYVAHEIMRRWYTPLGVLPLPHQPGGNPELVFANPLCGKERRHFATIDVKAATWTTARGSAPFTPANDFREGGLPGFDLDGELKEMIAGAKFAGHLTPGHKRCFHRRAKSFAPLMWSIGLLLRTYEGRSWALPRCWEVIYEPDGGTPYSNYHSMSPLPQAMGMFGSLEEFELALDADGRLIIVYEWGIGANAPAVVLQNDGLAFVGTREPVDVGARWRAGEDITHLANELAALARLPDPQS